MAIIIAAVCRKEILELPLEVGEDLADALARLDEGQRLRFPLCRPMPLVAKGLYEIRL